MSKVPIREDGKCLPPGEKVWVPKPVDKVIILGTGASIMSYVTRFSDGKVDNTFDPNAKVQIWAQNWNCFTMHHHIAFQMHDWRMDLPSTSGVCRQMWMDHPGPIICPRAHSDFPNAYEFPLVELVNHYGTAYLRNSVAYMTALAMFSGAKQIAYYGCDFNYPRDSHRHPGEQANLNIYEDGRCSVEFWMALAWKAGIEIILPSDTMLMDVQQIAIDGGILYGYIDKPKFTKDGNRVRVEWLKDKTFEEIAEVLDGLPAKAGDVREPPPWED